MWTYTQTNELYHHGVKGMRWGVRRAIRKQAKADYKAAKRAAQEKYKQDITKIKPDPNSKSARVGKKITTGLLATGGALGLTALGMAVSPDNSLSRAASLFVGVPATVAVGISSVANILGEAISD